MYPFKQKLQYGEKTPHQTGLGNIDLEKRIINIVPAEKGNEWYKDPFGHPIFRTEESITVDNPNGLGYVNIPTIVGGNKYNDKDAVMHYMLTGKHLGTFNGDGSMTPWKEASDSAYNVHITQQNRYTGQ